MQHFTVQRGVVFVADRKRSGGSLRFWLLWEASGADAVCLPIRLQRVPRSRWEHRLRAGEFPGADQHGLTVCSQEPRKIAVDALPIAARLSAAVVDAIVTTMRRAVESERIEERFRL